MPPMSPSSAMAPRAVAAIEAHDAMPRCCCWKSRTPADSRSSRPGEFASPWMRSELSVSWATCGGRTPLPVLRALADGWSASEYLASLARGSGRRSRPRRRWALSIPRHGIAGVLRGRQAPELDNAASCGAGHSRQLQAFSVSSTCPQPRHPAGHACGGRTPDCRRNASAKACRSGSGTRSQDKARRAVILACGGFEHDEEMNGSTCRRCR
jgi:hypothetical protein